MSKIKRSVLTLTSAAMAAGLAVCTAAYAETIPDRQFINRMDGSRMALAYDSTAEGSVAITLRAPGWHYQTAKWTVTPNAAGYRSIKNDAAGKCLQPATATPQAGDGLVVRTCDRSASQDWTVRADHNDSGTATGWYTYRPRTNTALAIALQTYQGSGSWDSIYLDRDQNTTDRLWRFLKDGATW
jgi:hypothetical protein